MYNITQQISTNYLIILPFCIKYNENIDFNFNLKDFLNYISQVVTKLDSVFDNKINIVWEFLLMSKHLQSFHR